jgi:CBS domain-containing protein
MVLTAKDILEKSFLSLKADTSASEAARLMKSSRHGFVVVIDAEGKPIGIVTEWDYLSKVIGEGKDASDLKLKDLMTTNLVSVNAEEGLDSVAQIMSEKGVRRLLVMQEGKVIGVVTARTVLGRLREYIDRVSSQIARLQAPKL